MVYFTLIMNFYIIHGLQNKSQSHIFFHFITFTVKW